MATTLAGVSVSAARVAPSAGAARPAAPKAAPCRLLSFPRWAGYPAAGRRLAFGCAAASGPSTPPNISVKVSESIKKAEEACAGDPASVECAAAWDEVEELSAAASHARDKLKSSDPLENYCKDNPETEECRTYDS